MCRDGLGQFATLPQFMRLYDACKSAYSNYKVAAGVLACMSYPLYVYMCVCVCVCSCRWVWWEQTNSQNFFRIVTTVWLLCWRYVTMCIADCIIATVPVHVPIRWLPLKMLGSMLKRSLVTYRTQSKWTRLVVCSAYSRCVSMTLSICII